MICTWRRKHYTVPQWIQGPFLHTHFVWEAEWFYLPFLDFVSKWGPDLFLHTHFLVPVSKQRCLPDSLGCLLQNVPAWLLVSSLEIYFNGRMFSPIKGKCKSKCKYEHFERKLLAILQEEYI